MVYLYVKLAKIDAFSHLLFDLSQNCEHQMNIFFETYDAFEQVLMNQHFLQLFTEQTFF